MGRLKISNWFALFGLAFFDAFEIESANQSQPKQIESCLRNRTVRRDGTIVWLKGFGEIKVFRVRATDGTADYWATSLDRMSEAERMEFAKSAWRNEMYHRALNQQCLIERAQCRRFRPVMNHIGLCIRAFVRIESHCYLEIISWIEAKSSIIRDAVRAYLSKPRYLLLSTA